MKKIGYLATLTLAIFGLAACGSKDEAASNKLVVGASATPHAEILEEAKPLLKAEGVDLEIKIFDDYVLPNKSLANGDIDANYFQHIPYFNKQVKENNYDFANAGAVHIEPMGFYSNKIKKIADLKDGATIITSNSVTDWGRILGILQDAQLIKLKDGVEIESATFDDIAENPKNLKFKTDIEPALLPTVYKNQEGDLVAINANYAFSAGLNPLEDAVLLEKDNSPYVNIIATQTAKKDDTRVKKLIEALHSEQVEKFVTDKWHGSVKIVAADAQ